MTAPRLPGVEDRRIKLSREVRVGELIGVVLALTALAHWYVGARLEPLNVEIRSMQASSAELRREIRDDLKVIRERVERVIEALPLRK